MQYLYNPISQHVGSGHAGDITSDDGDEGGHRSFILRFTGAMVCTGVWQSRLLNMNDGGTVDNRYTSVDAGDLGVEGSGWAERSYWVLS